MSSAQSTKSFSLRVDETRRLVQRLAALLLVFVAGAFFAALGYTQHRVGVELQSQAASYIDLIVSARQWVAVHEGVYVFRDADTPANPYLGELGIEPDVVAEDGRVLTMRNPAIMTRELSELAENRFGVVFHITSDEPVNPANAADPWEREALVDFRAGAVSASTVEGARGARIYRYMEPLFIEEQCLRCHGAQGYAVGDLRGGISVDIPYDSVSELMLRDAMFLGLFALVSSGLIVGSMGVLLGRYRMRLDEAAAEVERMASTDALTGLGNRWVALGRLNEEIARARRRNQPLAVLMIDVDRFKAVNDTFGHAAGDEALREIADRIASTVREYDVAARIGGEEFLVIAAETDLGAAEALAHRIHEAVRREPMHVGDQEITLTVCVGVSELKDDDPGPDRLLQRADAALYCAKESGRDRVERG